MKTQMRYVDPGPFRAVDDRSVEMFARPPTSSRALATSPVSSSPRTCILIRRIALDCRGVTAIEFAVLALPFFALICAIMQSALIVLAQQSLDRALERAARSLRTGTFQELADGSDPAQRLQRTMCGDVPVLFRCASVREDVTRGASFSPAMLNEPFDRERRMWADGFGTRFECPEGDDIVALRAAVPIPYLFKFPDRVAQRMADDTLLLVSTSVFRAEAYLQKSCQ